MPKSTSKPPRAPLEVALAAPLSAASLRAAAAQIDRIAPKTLADADKMINHVAIQFTPALAGGLSVLLRLQQEMTIASETMDEGGTVMNWASMIALLVAGFEQPTESLELCLEERKAIVGAA